MLSFTRDSRRWGVDLPSLSAAKGNSLTLKENLNRNCVRGIGFIHSLNFALQAQPPMYLLCAPFQKLKLNNTALNCLPTFNVRKCWKFKISMLTHHQVSIPKHLLIVGNWNFLLLEKKYILWENFAFSPHQHNDNIICNKPSLPPVS